MSKTIGYLKGVHALIATPDNLAEVYRFPEFKSLFDDVKAVAIDEVDACFKVISQIQLRQADVTPSHSSTLRGIHSADQLPRFCVHIFLCHA